MSFLQCPLPEMAFAVESVESVEDRGDLLAAKIDLAQDVGADREKVLGTDGCDVDRQDRAGETKDIAIASL